MVCHGIPNEKPLKEGDILNVDITVIKDGYHGDTSKMFLVGKTPEWADRLCQITQECMYKGISVVRPGAHLGDIGEIIQKHAERTASRWSANTAAMASARCSTRSRRSSTTVVRVPASS